MTKNETSEPENRPVGNRDDVRPRRHQDGDDRTSPRREGFFRSERGSSGRSWNAGGAGSRSAYPPGPQGRPGFRARPPSRYRPAFRDQRQTQRPWRPSSRSQDERRSRIGERPGRFRQGPASTRSSSGLKPSYERRLRPNYLLLSSKQVGSLLFSYLETLDHEFLVGRIDASLPKEATVSFLATQRIYYRNALQALRKSKILLQECGHFDEGSLTGYGVLGFKIIYLEQPGTTVSTEADPAVKSSMHILNALSQHVASLVKAGYQISKVNAEGVPAQVLGQQVLEAIANTRWS
jgi:hypothetical protein